MCLCVCVCMRARARACLLFLFVIYRDWFCLILNQLRLICIFLCLTLPRMNDMDMGGFHPFGVLDLRESPLILFKKSASTFFRFIVALVQKMKS